MRTPNFIPKQPSRRASSPDAPEISPWLGGNPKELQAAKRERAGRLYNPLRQLTSEWLANLLDRAEQAGDYPRLQWLYHYIEKRYGILRACKRRRLAAIGKLHWEIKTTEDTPAAAAQKRELEAVFNNVTNLVEALKFLCMATFRGFSILSIETDAEGWPAKLAPIPHHHVRRDGPYGDFIFCADSNDTSGIALVGPGVIIRVIEDPVNEIAAIRWLPRNLAMQDFNALLETVGDPPFFLEMPPNVSADNADKYQEMADAVVGAMRGTIPSGSKPYFAGANVRDGDIFKQYFKEVDSEVVIAATAGKLSILTEATGMGSGASKSQDAAFDDLAQEEAAEISELLNKAITAPWLAWAFPGQGELAYFELAAEPQDDLQAEVNRVTMLAQSGYRATRDWVAERLGLDLEIPSAPDEQVPPTPAKIVLPPPAAGTATANTANAAAAARRDIESALGVEFADFRAALGSLLEQDGAPARDALESMLAQVLNATPSQETVAHFEALAVAALADGWDAGATPTNDAKL